MFLLSNSSAISSLNLNHQDLLLFEDETLFVVSHITNIDIRNDDSVNVLEILNLENSLNTSISSFEFWLNHSYTNITIEDGDGSLDFNTVLEVDSSFLLSVILRPELAINKTEIIYISYSLLDSLFLEETLNYYYFEFYSTINFPTLYHQLSIKLPKDSFLHDQSSVTEIYPASYSQDTVGHRIIYTWVEEDVSPSSNPLYFVRFDIPLERKFPIWAVIVGPILGLMAGAGFTLWLVRKRAKSTFQTISGSLLNDAQKTLLKLVQDNDGKIKQRELIIITSFSRSKTSRNLLALEEKGLVKREKWGRNIIIHITKAGEMVIA